jgi:hypothetical protein
MSSAEATPSRALGHAIVCDDETFSGFCVLCGKICLAEQYDILEDCPGAVGLTPLEHAMTWSNIWINVNERRGPPQPASRKRCMPYLIASSSSSRIESAARFSAMRITSVAERRKGAARMLR